MTSTVFTSQLPTVPFGAQWELNVDFQMVFRAIGSDAIMFVAAVILYFTLYRLRTKHQMKVSTDKLASFKESSIVADQESSQNLKEHLVESIEVQRKDCVTLQSPRPQPEPRSAQHQHEQQRQEHPSQQCQLVQHPPKPQHFDAKEQLLLMQKYAAAKNIKDTLRTFRLIEQSGADLTSIMYNTVMRAWIKVGNVWAAENWMDEIKAAQMADESSFIILVRALMMVRDPEKAHALLHDMREAGVSPTAATFNEFLTGFARECLLNDGVSVLKEMNTFGVQPTKLTNDAVAKLVNSARKVNVNITGMQQIVAMSAWEPSDVPRLASLAAQVKMGPDTAPLCVHEIEIKGSRARVNAVRRSLQQYGFLGKAESQARPLDGHWHTDHGLTVFIDGKTARWSQKRASRLKFTSADLGSCTLGLYGEPAVGRLAQPIVPGAAKALRWDNGDVWHSYDGRVIGGTPLFAQSMTKTVRDEAQDKAYCMRANASLKCLSKQGLPFPSILEDVLMDYLGNDLYVLCVHFESKTNLMPPCFVDISRRHPRVGLRHCWVRPSVGACGQRTLANGEETDEACFNRHIDAVCLP